MSLTPEHFRENPWWSDREAIDEDFHLEQLRDRQLVFDPGIPFDLENDGVYTLRGPRQVGKTTLLKSIVRELLVGRAVTPRLVMYVDVGAVGLGNHKGLQSFLASFLEDTSSRHRGERRYMLLDEVTGIRDWGTAIRALYDRGRLADTTVVATGSHALDVKRGGERAPGRRGSLDEPNWTLMPLGFRDFVSIHEPELEDSLDRWSSLSPEQLAREARAFHARRDKLEALFTRYEKTGGYPYAVDEEHRHGRVSRGAYRQFRDAILGEVTRGNLRESYFRELLSWLSHNRLGREFSWRDASGETQIGSKDTARKYLEASENLYIWRIFYRLMKPDEPRKALKSPKKLYPTDPFGWHALSSWVTGSRDPWKSTLRRLEDPEDTAALVESIVAEHLRRAYGELCYYHRESGGGSEIDFVCFDGEARRHLIEVKYRNHIRDSDVRTVASNGGGIVLSKDTLEWREEANVAVIPVVYFLAGLPGRLTLYAD